EADGGRDHRADQVEPAVAHLLQGDEQVRQPGGAGRDGRGQAAGQGRHALFAARVERPGAGAGRLRQRGGDPARGGLPGVGPVLRGGAVAAEDEGGARGGRVARGAAALARRPVRGGGGRDRARGPRQRVAASAGIGDRLRAGGAAGGLHGGGRHRGGV